MANYIADTDEKKQLIIKELSSISSSDLPWVIKNTKKDGSIEYKLQWQTLASYIKKEVQFLFVNESSEQATLIYIYDNGVYKRISDNVVKAKILNFIPQSLANKKDVEEIFFNITTQDNFIAYDELDSDENIINFEDGIYNLVTHQLLPHSPKYLTTIQIPANYSEIKDATECPVFDEYLETLCAGKESEKKKKILLQFLGLAISNIYGYRPKKMLFLRGAGNSGKSQIKALAEYLIGNNSVCSMELKYLSERFGTAPLFRKRLCGSNDLSRETINDTSILKQLTGGDSIFFEFKHSGGFNARYNGVLWFNCNNMPVFRGDDGKHLYDRILLIECNNVIPPEKRDKMLLDKMKREKNAIIKKALESLDELIKNNLTFDETQETIEFRERFAENNNTLFSFVRDCCIVSEEKIPPELRFKLTDFKRVYNKYIEENFRGKNNINTNDIRTLLLQKYNCEIKKSDGYDKLSNIIVDTEQIREYGLFEMAISRDRIKEGYEQKQADRKIQQQHLINTFKNTGYKITENEDFFNIKLGGEEDD